MVTDLQHLLGFMLTAPRQMPAKPGGRASSSAICNPSARRLPSLFLLAKQLLSLVYPRAASSEYHSSCAFPPPTGPAVHSPSTHGRDRLAAAPGGRNQGILKQGGCSSRPQLQGWGSPFPPPLPSPRQQRLCRLPAGMPGLSSPCLRSSPPALDGLPGGTPMLLLIPGLLSP